MTQPATFRGQATGEAASLAESERLEHALGIRPPPLYRIVGYNAPGADAWILPRRTPDTNHV
jgi:hypothetical protein